MTYIRSSLACWVSIALICVPILGVFPQTAHAVGATTIILTSGTSFTVPDDWNSASNTIEVIGGGGGAANGGGSGGAYAKSANVALTGGSTVSYHIGAAGANSTSSPSAGGDTYFCDATTNCASITGTAVVAGAKGGAAASGGTGGTGGNAASSVGDVTYNGGDGGDAIDLVGVGGYSFAGGGGGSAGPLGAGGNGGNANGASGIPYGGSGGGGSSDGGVLTSRITDATDDAIYADVSTEASALLAVAFSTDGTKMYVSDNGGTDSIYQYSLSPAWDITSATYDSVSLDTSAYETPSGIAFNDDGTILYVGLSTSGEILMYPLASAWDISTAGIEDISSLANACYLFNFAFSSDGSHLFALCETGDTVTDYGLSTPWDITTATAGTTYNVFDAINISALGVTLAADGMTMYIVGTEDFSTYSVYQFTLATAWDLSSAMPESGSFDITNVLSGVSATFKDYETFYVPDSSGGIVEQLSMPLTVSGKDGYGTSDGFVNPRGAGGGGGRNASNAGSGSGGMFESAIESYVSAGNGTSGGGGGGASLYAGTTSGSAEGGAGSMHSEWTDNSGGTNDGASAGAGSGAGGGGFFYDTATSAYSDIDGGDGGGYGSGGGGVGDNHTYIAAISQTYTSQGMPGASQPGVIVLTYTPSGGGGGSPVRTLRLMDGVRLMNGVRLY